MKYITLIALVGFCAGFTATKLIDMYIQSRTQNNRINVDLPEEISQANENDTLIAIKRHNTIYITFR